MHLLAALSVGLLGSAHCVGMCGGFVALLSVGGGRAGVARRQAAYFTGKTATYSLFGAIAGATGGLLTELLGGIAGLVAVGLGLAMVGVGLALCGVAWGGASAPGARVAQRLGPAIGRLVGSGSAPSLVALGALNGLLPCGLVYGMLGVAASTGGAVTGAATMAVFGVATVPALALTGMFSSRLRPESRVRMQRLAGALVVAMGLLTVVRGAGAFVPTPHAHAPDVICKTGT